MLSAFGSELYLSFPNSSKYLHCDLNNAISEMLSLVSTVAKETLLLADFNVNHLVPGGNAEFKAILNLYVLSR